MNRFSKLTGFGALALGLLVAGSAGAQTGVSDTRVSLPEGPGSLEGIGENVATEGNMGQMSYSVQVRVPQGFSGLTPQLAMGYSSGAGNGLLGMGWDLTTPYIERMTARGVPEYDTSDEFAADGSDELVLIPGSSPPRYRSRREGSFVRWHWMDQGGGTDGYWVAEYPDGRVGYFGADADGNTVANARMAGPDGTFRYNLVELVDVWGHRAVYTYDPIDGNIPLISQIGYVYSGGDTPRYTVDFEYEGGREDEISDAKPGFETRLEYRLLAIDVDNGLRRYELNYEDYATSGGFTRLAGVTEVGAAGGINPIGFSFEYTQSIGGSCMGDVCQDPYINVVGSIGSDLASRTATLVDLNGDALPDFVDTSATNGANHIIYIAELDSEGNHTFAAPQTSTEGTTSGHQLNAASVQVFDINGDGFADLMNSLSGDVLINDGSGDWAETISLFTTAGLPDFSADFDPGDGELGTLRFFDYDNDKRIDLMRSQGTNTTIWRNTDEGFVIDPGVQPIGVGFESDTLQLSDMNGDGLLDPVQVLADAVQFRINLGWGQWSEWNVVTGLSFNATELEEIELEDINGDGLSDIVAVRDGEVEYWLNRNGESFDPPRSITSAGGVSIPPRTSNNSTVLYADMNGNGSSDIVWVDTSGSTRYLELFPVRPNLLTRIDNNIGSVTEISYSTSVLEQARAIDNGGSWQYEIPNAMLVVSETDTYDTLSDVHDVLSFEYDDAYYDGEERQFRGFGIVRRIRAESTYQQGGTTHQTFELGIDDPYMASLLTESLVYGNVGGGPSLLRISRATQAGDDAAVLQQLDEAGGAHPGQLPAMDDRPLDVGEEDLDALRKEVVSRADARRVQDLHAGRLLGGLLVPLDVSDGPELGQPVQSAGVLGPAVGSDRLGGRRRPIAAAARRDEEGDQDGPSSTGPQGIRAVVNQRAASFLASSWSPGPFLTQEEAGGDRRTGKLDGSPSHPGVSHASRQARRGLAQLSTHRRLRAGPGLLSRRRTAGLHPWHLIPHSRSREGAGRPPGRRPAAGPRRARGRLRAPGPAAHPDRRAHPAPRGRGDPGRHAVPGRQRPGPGHRHRDRHRGRSGAARREPPPGRRSPELRRHRGRGPRGHLRRAPARPRARSGGPRPLTPPRRCIVTQAGPSRHRLAALGATVLALASAAAFAVHVGQLRFLSDDCFISFRYSRHLVDGLGLVWNAGEAVEGYTNFLWVLLMAAALKVGLTPETVSQVLGIGSGAVILVTLAIAGTRRHGWSLPAAFPGLLLALNGSFAAWCSSGLETMFVAALLWGAVLAYDGERQRSSRGPWGSAALLTLAVLTRPDAAVVGLVLGTAFLVDVLAGRRAGRGLVVWALLPVVVVGGHALWRYQYYGSWLPNTFHAKVSGPSWDQAWLYLSYYHRTYAIGWFLPLLLVAVLPGASHRARLALAIIVAHLAYVVSVGGDRFEFRFLVVLLPFLAELLTEALHRLGRGGAGRRILAVAAAGALAGTTLWGTHHPALVGDRTSIASIESIDRYAQARAEQGRALRDLIDRGELPRDLVLCVGGAGAVPYYTGWTTVDRRGLNDAYIARLPLERRGVIGHERDAPLEYLKERKVAVFDFFNQLIHSHPNDLLQAFQQRHGPDFARRLTHGGRPLRIRAVRLETDYLIFATFVSNRALEKLFPGREIIVCQ